MTTPPDVTVDGLAVAVELYPKLFPWVAVEGLTGAVAASRWVGATASGAPSSGTFAVGDFAIDQTGKVWICTVAGTSGTWVQAGASTSGQLTALGLNGTGTAPTIAGVTHAVASAPLGHDMGGSFTLTTDGTGVTGPATIATITFGTPLGAAPVAVLVSIDDVTDGTHIATITNSATSTVITIKDSATLVASKVYNVTYIVIAS